MEYLILLHIDRCRHFEFTTQAHTFINSHAGNSQDAIRSVLHRGKEGQRELNVLLEETIVYITLLVHYPWIRKTVLRQHNVNVLLC